MCTNFQLTMSENVLILSSERCHNFTVELLLINIFLFKSAYSHAFLWRYGCTKVLISDQGREFVNDINKNLLAQLKTDHRISTAYHPQTNGLVERFNQTLQRSLVKMVNNNQDDWDEYKMGYFLHTEQASNSQLNSHHLRSCTVVRLCRISLTVLDYILNETCSSNRTGIES